MLYIQYHSNGCNKPYTLQAQGKLESRKRKEQKTENNKAESSVLVEQDRQAQNDKNQMKIEVMNAFYAETKLLEKTINFTDYVKLKEQNCFCVQQNLIWVQFSPKYQSI